MCGQGQFDIRDEVSQTFDLGVLHVYAVLGLRTVTVQIRVYSRFLRVHVPYRWLFSFFVVRPVIIQSGWDDGLFY